ncbi:MAG: chorismate synthase [Oscillospiraceae bacterium]|jgi:chorismate synthase|nr:chorismate synthase [Oscillospiraceae bacterium]
MGSTWGTKLRISVFGESHGKSIGVTVDGLPAGVRIDFDAVRRDLERRAPGRDSTSTARAESDEFEVLSGLFNGVTTGAPLTAIAYNADMRSRDYTPSIPRPGHADLTAYSKYGGYADYRGGGHFSGRLTAPLVYAGALAKQILRERHGCTIAAHALSIHGETDPETQRAAILEAKSRGDSVGGVVECTVEHAPADLGEPMFHGVESVLSSILFAIPAVKGVEFGDGFGFANSLGSEVSDGYAYDSNGVLTALANHNGGINGGIANGNPIVFRVAFKPTPTIALPQQTVNLETRENVTHSFVGRHDPCIVLRAIPVVEAAAAIGLLNL